MTVGSFEGIDTSEKIINIVDPLTAENRAGHFMGYLRSLPYLFEYGVIRYTFPPNWLRILSQPTIDEVLEERNDHYRYRVIEDLTFFYELIDSNQPPEDIRYDRLCQYTNQGIEEHTEYSTTHKIIRAYKDGQIDELFLVTDSEDFRIEDVVTAKPLVEELERVEPLSYEGMAKKYITENFDKKRLGFSETLNVWLHHAAAEYEDVMGVEPARIADLFKFDELLPGVRTWNILEFLASETSKAEPDHISAVTRPWVEKDNSVIETYIRNALQEFEYDRNAVQKFRTTGQRPE